MYQPNHAPPFGSPQSRDSPGRAGGLSGAPSGLTDGHFRHNKPHLVRPQCSSFPLDYYTMIGLGRTYQRLPHWNPTPAQCHLPDNSDRASEEFLRCIAANKPLPNYLKGNMEHNLADAFKSADVVKEAVRSDPDLQKLLTRSKSCNQSCGKSKEKSHARSRSRGKSRACSRSRGKSRARSRSRAKSRARSRSRAKSRTCSRSRAKSRTRSRSRAKSRARSRSRSRGRSKSHTRGKSALRERHRSRSRSQTRISSPTQSRSRGQRSSSSGEKDHDKKEKRKRSIKSSSSVDKDENPTGSCLLKSLKMVLNSRELEDRFSNLKDAFLGIKSSDEKKTDKLFPGQHKNFQENLATDEDPIILPHNRVGSDFSWLQGPSQKEFEAEESFLYGNEERKSSEILSCSEKHGRAQEPKHCNHTLRSSEHLQNTSKIASALLDSTECEKIKSILKCLGSADVAKGQALETSFSKATQEMFTRQDGNCSSPIPAGTRKADGDEQRSRLKRATTSKMELLMKELQKLMKHNGFDFLTPVIGFYCQKCEEFFGDWSSAENHAAIHCYSCSSEVLLDKCTGGREMHSHHSNRDAHAHQYPSDKKDHKDSNYHSNPGEQLMDRDWREELDRRNRRHTDHTTRKESLFLEEEMKKERMLITVSQEPDLPSHINLHKELQTTESEKTMKTKSQKKKKKKKDGKKKKKKDKS